MTRAGLGGATAVALNETAGEQLVEAHVPPIASPTNSSVTFHVSATPESAESLVPVAGDSQSAQVLLALPESLVVQAVDRFGNGVPGVEVTWEAKNGGEVSPENVTTGADGRAATQRMLGKDPGSYSTDARSATLDAPAVVANVYDTWATPLVSVSAVSAGVSAAPSGATNTTVTCSTGRPLGSVTLTARGRAKAWPTVADWLSPAAIEI